MSKKKKIDLLEPPYLGEMQDFAHACVVDTAQAMVRFVQAADGYEAWLMRATARALGTVEPSKLIAILNEIAKNGGSSNDPWADRGLFRDLDQLSEIDQLIEETGGEA